MANPAPADVTVVLVPGLWMPAWAMRPLERRLAHCGFRTLRFGYRSARSGLQVNAEQLARVLATLGAPVHLVGHSLGGVLALHATLRYVPAGVQRIVMLGSPYRDSYAARKLARSALGRWMLGKSVPEWLDCERLPISADIEVGVIAGSAAFGLGALIAPGLPRPHDGVVSVAETQVQMMRACTIVPVGHSGMLLSGQVARLVCHFLRHGNFASHRAQSVEAVP